MDITAQHEAAHVAAALWGGLGVIEASTAKAPNGNIIGVTLAPSGQQPNVKYSWGVFYRFPFLWETKILAQTEEQARFSCSHDLTKLEVVLRTFSAQGNAKMRNDIEAECLSMLEIEDVRLMISETAAAFVDTPTLKQDRIYGIWLAIAKKFGRPFESER